MQESKVRSVGPIATQKQIPDQLVVFSPSNRHFALIGKATKTLIYDSRTMKQLAKHKILSKLAHFQYDTGLIALVPCSQDNKVVIWDFKYERIVREIDFVKPIANLAYIKNILVVASDDRLMMHDLAMQQNTSYMPLLEGSKCIISSFFEKLRVGFFKRQGFFVNLGLWDDSRFEIEQVFYDSGKFDYKGDTILLYTRDGILIYRGRCLTNRVRYNPCEFVGCVFDANELQDPKGIVLVSRIGGKLQIQWHPIYRLAKENQKNTQYKYELMFEEILEQDFELEDFQKSLVYVRDGDLHIFTPGQEAQIYKKVEVLNE